MSSTQPVLVCEVDDHVATLSLNRPKVLNALSIELLESLSQQLAAIHGDASIRAVVLRGEGRAFCAGGDLRDLSTSGDRRGDGFRHGAGIFHQVVLALRALPQLVIAAIDGVAAGGGMSLVLACDLRVMADDTFMQVGYTGRGFSCDGGLSHFLPRIAGPARAIELMSSDRRISAEECERLGLVQRIAPAAIVRAEASEWALSLSRGPSKALAYTKQLVSRSLWTSLGDQLEAERTAIADCADSAEGREGLAAFVEKREPNFLSATE